MPYSLRTIVWTHALIQHLLWWNDLPHWLVELYIFFNELRWYCYPQSGWWVDQWGRRSLDSWSRIVVPYSGCWVCSWRRRVGSSTWVVHFVPSRPYLGSFHRYPWDRYHHHHLGLTTPKSTGIRGRCWGCWATHWTSWSPGARSTHRIVWATLIHGRINTSYIFLRWLAN